MNKWSPSGSGHGVRTEGGRGGEDMRNFRNGKKKKSNKDMREKQTEEKQKASSPVIKSLWWRFLKQTSVWNLPAIPSFLYISKYIPADRKRSDRYTDRPQLLQRRLDTLRGEPFHYARHIVRTWRPEIQTTLPSSAVSNSRGKRAKQHLHAG